MDIKIRINNAIQFKTQIQYISDVLKRAEWPEYANQNINVWCEPRENGEYSIYLYTGRLREALFQVGHCLEYTVSKER
jgi:hypothetical protein